MFIDQLIGFESKLSFDTLYKEIYQFYIDNNHFKPSIDNTTNIINICNVYKCNNKSVFSICHKHRNMIANRLYMNLSFKLKDEAFTKEVANIMIDLMMNDEMTIKAKKKNEYICNNFDHFFCQMYSFLIYQTELISQLLLNLSFYDSTQIDDEETYKYLVLIHCYLNQVSQLLILLNLCLNQDLIYIFYPWFEQAVGTKIFHKIFNIDDNYNGYDIPINRVLDKVVSYVYLYWQDINFKQRTVRICLLKQILYDLYINGENTDGIKIGKYNNYKYNNLIHYSLFIESKCAKMIDNIKSKNMIDYISNSNMASVNDKLNRMRFGLTDLSENSQYVVNKLLYHSSSKVNVYKDSKITKSYYHYRYSDIDSLRRALSLCDYVIQYNIIDDIITIICQYYPFVDWSMIDKSNTISITNSNDNKISYATFNDYSGHSKHNTILLNESILTINKHKINQFIDIFFEFN